MKTDEKQIGRVMAKLIAREISPLDAAIEVQDLINKCKLDAMKEGMRRATEIVKNHQPSHDDIGYRTVILSAAENLTEKGLV